MKEADLNQRIQNTISLLNFHWEKKDINVYKYLLAQLEIYLGEYACRLNKKHLMDDFLIKFYEKLWSIE